MLTRRPRHRASATTVGAHGWAGRDHGPLLDLLAAVCDVFVTTDQNLPFQQQLHARAFATVILVAPSNRIKDPLPLVDGLHVAIDQATAGQVPRVARKQTLATDSRALNSGAFFLQILSQAEPYQRLRLRHSATWRGLARPLPGLRSFRVAVPTGAGREKTPMCCREA